MYSIFNKKITIFISQFFLLFSTLKNKPSRSRRSASGVKEKCVRGQGEVRRGSRKSASGVKEKCFSWITHIQRKHFSLTPDALLLDPWCTSPWALTHLFLTPDALFLDPWRTFPWSLTHFSLTWRAYFSELKKAKKWWEKSSKLFLKTLYILKYSYALVVKS